MTQYELFADEAWTHRSKSDPTRYHTFYGGICGPAHEIAQLDTALRSLIGASNIKREVKWGNLTPVTNDLFRQVAACLIDYLGSKSHAITYRQMFCDRSFVRVAPDGEPPQTDLDVQYKLCYQFLKSAFGLRFLPRIDPGLHEVLVRLDTHSSQKHKAKLEEFLAYLPAHLERPDLRFRVTFMNSARVPCIQACDLLMGAAGSYGNKMHKRRPGGRRGMSDKQKVRRDFAKFIYDQLRRLDKAERGSGAFNWFETTGHDGEAANRMLHKLRIWKFKPARFQIDKGWQNDNLDRQGRFVSSDLQANVRSPNDISGFTY